VHALRYEEFAENLQKEIETDTGIHFGIVEKHQFTSILVTNAAGQTKALRVQQSEAIWTHLKETSLVDARGKVQDSLMSVRHAVTSFQFVRYVIFVVTSIRGIAAEGTK
jgi:hypothetical protein